MLRRILLPYRFHSLALIAGVALLPSNSLAQSLLNWSGAGGDANWSNPANWSGMAPTNGEKLIFSGATQPNSYNDISSYTNGSITFSNGGFNLAGNGITIGTGITNLAGTNVISLPIAVETAGVKVWSVAAGSELQVAGPITSATQPQQDFAGGGGTLRILGGMTLTSNPLLRFTDCNFVVDGSTLDTVGGIRIGYSGSASTGQLTITNNGTVKIGGGSAIRIGETAKGIVTINSGSLNVVGSGGIHLGQTKTGNGIVNQNGGDVSATASSGGGLQFSVVAGADGTYNLNGGTLTVNSIFKNASGTAVFNFNGGTLIPNVPSETFMSGLTTANVKAGGMKVNTFGSDITIDQILSGSGPIIKEGPGAMLLTGANTHTGSITVNEGKVGLTTARTGNGAITVNDFTELSVSVASSGSSLAASTLTLGSSSGCTLDLDFGIFGNPSVPLIPTTSLVANGTVTVNISGSPLSVGQFKLITYTGAIGGSGFAAFSAPTLPSGVSGFLSNNVAESSVDLVITAAGGYGWKGNINGDWDFSTPNWIDQTSGTSSTYQDANVAQFTDSAVRSSVNVAGSFSPNAMIVNNSTLTYNFTGSGPIASPSFHKQGSGTVTFATGSPVSFDRIDIDAGTMGLQYSSDTTLSSVLGGPGTLALSSSGTVTLQTDATDFTGNTVIQSGTALAGSGSVLGSTGSLTVASGATLDVNDQNFGSKPIIVSGAGVGGQGAMIDSTSATAVKSASVNVTMVGDTTFGCVGRWDIRATAAVTGTSGLQGNGFNLTKVGAGFLSIACQNAASYWNLNLGNIDIRQGTVTFAERLNWGDTNKLVTIADTAGLNFYDLSITNPAAANVFMTNANFRSDGPADGTNVFNGPIALFGATNTFDTKVPLIVNGAFSGSGVLSKSNVNLIELNGASSFTGTIDVGAGILGGSGSVAGNVLISGGTLAPGSVLNSSVGTFEVGGNLVATNAAIFELNRDAAQNSDRVNVTGAIMVGGTLTVTNVGAALQGGETFALFNKAVSGNFANIVLPTLAPELSWVNNLTVDGTLKVAGSSAPPQFGTISISGGNVQLSGSGGAAGATYYIVASPDIAAPIATWTAVTTNQFDASGNFSASIPQDAGQPQLFYTLRLP